MSGVREKDGDIFRKKRMELERELVAYLPWNEQERVDRQRLLECLREGGDDIFTRQNTRAHFTASAWVTDAERTSLLMCYHRIYDSWSWMGGHADGNADLREVALREVYEESGVHARILLPRIFSVEILTVDGHEKRGAYVGSHLHLNVTYLLEADRREALSVNPEENKGVAWFPLEEAVSRSSEPWFRERIYTKLNEKLREASATSLPSFADTRHRR